MRKLLIPLLAAFLLPSSVEANWFGKYNSRYDANEACEKWMLKGFKYTYKVREKRGYSGDIPEIEPITSPYWKRSFERFQEYMEETRSIVEKTKRGFTRSCFEEKETNQFIGRLKSCLKKKEYSVEEWEKLFELKSCEKRKYFKY